MIKQLEYLAIKLCENLPFDFTFFEKNGFCQKPSEDCKYCSKKDEKNSLCYKKTYTLFLNMGK